MNLKKFEKSISKFLKNSKSFKFSNLNFLQAKKKKLLLIIESEFENIRKSIIFWSFSKNVKKFEFWLSLSNNLIFTNQKKERENFDLISSF